MKSRKPSVSTPIRPLDELEQTIAARAEIPSAKSYTCELLAGGIETIGAKIIEEAAEVVEAAAEPGDAGREHFVREVGDLIYHLLVMMRLRNCTLADLEGELARRSGVSGLEEKAARKGSGFRVQGSLESPATEP
jgi:phosphoribosyl-ATP pyrophosphohydrolase